jgi:universal stress protein E
MGVDRSAESPRSKKLFIAETRGIDVERFRRILCVVDPTNQCVQSIERAAVLASRNDAELRVVGVLDAPPASSGDRGGLSSADIQDLTRAEAREELGRLVASASNHGVDIQTGLLVGTPFIEVIREVLRCKFDLVMMTAEGGRGFGNWLFGGTSMRLLRKCPCAVWILKPGVTQHHRILACVDPDPENRDAQRQALDEKVVKIASSLARRESASLLVAHCWRLVGEHMLRRRGSREQVDQWRQEANRAHLSEFEELVERCELKKEECSMHLIEGHPRDVLPSFAAQQNVDLIVMGTVCRTGLSGFIIGNTAEVVLRESQASILALKPDGFVSPVNT